MAGIFIAGNGFDIAHGIPTKYSEFRKYIISRYPDALKFRDAKISMEELEYVPTEEFAAEILLSTMDKVSGIDWMNFEAELAHIDFSRKFPIPNHKENETEEEDNYLMRNYLLYMDSLTDEFIISAEYWWEIFLEDWIKEVQISIKINNYDRKKDLAELFKKEELMFFSFNYTKTLEKLYGIKEVTHIHNYVGEKLVLGHGEEEIDAKGASVELLQNWRTDKRELSSLWDEVRGKKSIITEKLSMDGPFSRDLGEDIFDLADDEVVLCLNYDGKFGLNNMNQYFQNANTKSKAFSWAEWTFKIGDKIIFLDTRRSSLLYNNLKGTIENIEMTESSIIFTIDIRTYLTEEQCEDESFQYVKNNDDGTRIKLEVIAWDDELPEEDRIKTVIPFQIAYAISIHKAQGLEYKSVKVVIPSSNAEKITHSIFYTAITRAKENLKIYWSAETMDAIVKSFSEQEHRTLQLIKKRLNVEDRY